MIHRDEGLLGLHRDSDIQATQEMNTCYIAIWLAGPTSCT